MYNRICNLDYATRKQAIQEFTIQIEGEPEMNDFESAFLCALIDTYRPYKVVEVGVAGGGTTGVIVKKLHSTGIEAEMYSCDLNEKYYQNRHFNGEFVRTGFLADRIIENSNVKHKFLLGDYIPAFVEEIGSNIDFLILDTVHFMPGELLDFLAIFPYLSNGAIVVLHDVRFNLLNARSSEGMATNVLFSSVVADKIYNYCVQYGGEKQYANIGAFMITEDTSKYLENVFQSLLLPWYYRVDSRQKKAYEELFRSHYCEEFVDMYLYAVEKQNNLVSTKANIIRTVFRQIRNGDPIMSGLYEIRMKFKSHNSTR